jgi:hypothetical protein
LVYACDLAGPDILGFSESIYGTNTFGSCTAEGTSACAEDVPGSSVVGFFGLEPSPTAPSTAFPTLPKNAILLDFNLTLLQYVNIFLSTDNHHLYFIFNKHITVPKRNKK